MSTNVEKPAGGAFDFKNVRYVSDLRQVGGLMLILGMVSVIAPLPKIATLISPGPDGVATKGIPLWGLIGSLCLCTIGVLSVFGGYAQVVHDYNNKFYTILMIVFTQTAFIPYITDMTAIGRGAKGGIPEPGKGPFGLAAYPEIATNADAHVIGAMGIIGVLCYGFTYVGSISFMQFTQFAYLSGKPEERSAPYYRGRQYVYCFLLTLAGFAQLLLGGYLLKNFGGGALPSPLGAAVFQVSFPGISVFVGLMQILLGLWGIARGAGVGVLGENDVSYQIAMFFGWFLQLVLQIIVQMSYPEGNIMAPMLAMIACMSVGLNLMPAYLDYKGRSVPENIVHAGIYNNSPSNNPASNVAAVEKGDDTGDEEDHTCAA